MAYVDDDTANQPGESSWHDANSKASALDEDYRRLTDAVNRDMAGLSDITGSAREDTDTMGSFDISNDALGHSTRKLDMLPMQTPTINSRMMKDNFANFTYAHEGDDTAATSIASYEIGRGHANDNSIALDSMDMSSKQPFSIGGQGPKKPNRRTGLGRLGSMSSDTSDLLRSRASNNGKEQLGSPTRKSGTFPNIDFSPKATPKRTAKTRLSSGGSAGSGGKITELVSNSGSGGSRSKAANREPRIEEDAFSDAGSVTGRSRAANSRFTNMRSRKTSVGNNASGHPPTRMEELTDDIAFIPPKMRKTNSSGSVPNRFKSTGDFLKELGLTERTSTLTMQQRLKALKDPGSTRRQPTRFDPTPAAEPSFVIPQIPDMTELFSGDATRFSMKRGAAETHKPIDSIPIPQDERAVLAAMRLLQEKVLALEGSKASTEQRCLRLEKELRKAEAKFQQEQRRADLVEEELTRRHEGNSAFGGRDNGDANERHRAKESLQLQMEKLKLESNLSTLKSHIADLERELDTANISLQHMHDERNAAVNAVAYAISANEDLKISNQELLDQLENLQLQKSESERLWKAREDKLRRKAREFREAAAVAETAMKEAARKDRKEREAIEKATEARRQEQRRIEREIKERQEQERIEKEREEARLALAKKEFDREVEEKMRSIRPDLFVNRTSPVVVPGSAFAPGKTIGKRRIAMPRSRIRKANADDSTAELSPIDFNMPRRQQNERPFGDATSSEETQRTTAEIYQKRKAPTASTEVKAKLQEEARLAALHKRKETERAAANTKQKPKGRVVKVVTTYLVDGDTQVYETEKQAEDQLAEALKSVHITEQPPLPPTVTLTNPPQPETEVLPPLPSDDDDLEEVPRPLETASSRTVPPFTTASINKFADHLVDGSHDSAHCTVCVRRRQVLDEMDKRARENPLADIEHAMPAPAPALDPASLYPGAEDPNATTRPSLPPKEQLQKVVRQLRDEYSHLKMAYQEMHGQYMALDPAVGKKARKTVVREMNEIVAEMETKCDQIYALYDVNEGFLSGEAGAEVVNGDDTENLIAMLQA